MATRSIGFDIFAKDRASSVFDKVGASASTVEKKFGKAGAALDRTGQIAGKALAGGLLLAGAAAVKMGQAAADDEAAASKLAQTLRTAAGATDEQVVSTEAWISAQGRALGVTDDELRPAIGRLAAATGDLGKAQDLAALAMDVSAGSGKSLQQVTEALQKGVNGSVGGLSRLGVATKDASGETKSLEEITKDLAATYEGAASKAADTTAGKQKRLTVSMGELGEEIGAKVLPAMVKLSEVGLKAVDWIDRNQKLVAILGGTVAGLAATLWTASLAMRAWGVATAAASGIHAAYTAVVGLSSGTVGTFVGVKTLEAATWVKATAGTIAATAATVAHTAVTKAAAAGQWLLNAALTANPIGIVVVAIAALVAGMVIAYKKSETFREIVTGAWNGIKVAAVAVGNFFVSTVPRWWAKITEVTTSAWNGIVGFFRGIPGKLVAVFRNFTLPGLMIKHWSSIRSAAERAWSGLVNFIKGIPGRIVSALGNLGSLLWNAGTQIIQGLIDGIASKVSALTSKLKSITNLIPKIKGPLDKDKILLKPAGVAIIQGLIDGIESKKQTLTSVLGRLTDFIKAQGSKIRDLLAEKRGIASSFASSFGSSVFGSDATDLGSILALAQQQASQAAGLKSNIASLIKNGVSEGVLQQLLAGGSGGIAQIQALAGASSSQIAQFNAATAATSSSLNQAGGMVGGALLDDDIRATKRNRRLAQEIAKELRKIPAANITINGALDPRGVAQQVVKLLEEYSGTGGRPIQIKVAS